MHSACSGLFSWLLLACYWICSEILFLWKWYHDAYNIIRMCERVSISMYLFKCVCSAMKIRIYARAATHHGIVEWLQIDTVDLSSKNTSFILLAWTCSMFLYVLVPCMVAIRKRWQCIIIVAIIIFVVWLMHVYNIIIVKYVCHLHYWLISVESDILRYVQDLLQHHIRKLTIHQLTYCLQSHIVISMIFQYLIRFDSRFTLGRSIFRISIMSFAANTCLPSVVCNVLHLHYIFTTSSSI